MSTANITQENLSNAIKLLKALGNRLNNVKPHAASHVKDGDGEICSHACTMLKAIRYGYLHAGSIPDAIKSLEDLGQRLDTAEALSESYIQPKDWFVCAHAASILQAISNGFMSIEPPYLIGFEQSGTGAAQTLREVA